MKCYHLYAKKDLLVSMVNIWGVCYFSFNMKICEFVFDENPNKGKSCIWCITLMFFLFVVYIAVL